MRELDGEAMVTSLLHRGPDALNGRTEMFGRQRVYLGHSRLRIVDLSDAGGQPMTSADGNSTIVYNGEVYNHSELREHYLRDIQWRSHTDTEVVLELLNRFAEKALEMLNGDFALAFLDRRQGVLRLVRDRFGVKPLYYYNDEKRGVFAFASEIKALLAAGIPAEIDLDRIPEYLVFKYIPGRHTLFKNIHRLDPAHCLTMELKTRRISLEPYWRLPKAHKMRPSNFHSAGEELRGLMAEAVRMRLMGDVPVGNFLSGGLDSSVIAFHLKDHPEIMHYCARKSHEDLRREGTTSDYYYASILKSRWNLPFMEIPIGGDTLDREMIRKTLYFSDDLIADGSHIPSFLINQAAAHSSRVVLSGMGADEIFLGYAGHRITLISQWLRRMHFGMDRLPVRFFRYLAQGRGHFLAYRRYLHRLGRYHRDKRWSYGPFNVVGDVDSALEIFPGGEEQVDQVFNRYFGDENDPFPQLLRFELENFLVKNLHYMDRMSMAHSVEARVPFLDHHVVEFAVGLPRKFRMTLFGGQKRVLKEAYRNLLPASIINRRKAGFGMPLRTLLADRGRVIDLMEPAFFENFSGFSMDAIQSVIDSHVEGRMDQSSLIYALISFRQWYRLWVESTNRHHGR